MKACKFWCWKKLGAAPMGLSVGTGTSGVYACSQECCAAGHPLHPDSGEPPREIALHEALEADRLTPGCVEAQDGDGNWTTFTPTFPWTRETARMCSSWRFRLKPPAPAPVSRVREAFEKWFGDNSPIVAPSARTFAEQMVREALDGIDAELHELNYRDRGGVREMIAKTRAKYLGPQAEREYLGEGGGK